MDIKKQKEGHLKQRLKISWHRWSKKFVAKAVKTQKSYQFLRLIALGAYYRAVDNDVSGKKLKKDYYT